MRYGVGTAGKGGQVGERRIIMPGGIAIATPARVSRMAYGVLRRRRDRPVVVTNLPGMISGHVTFAAAL